ncbi:MAG: hypothetical protein KatS3mg109_1791 [Pirellulaceae bacterium]|nr:MAG: hypothetical protein KatS3mg109_1791 [Pirellulaceae bacterium]
MAGDPIGAGTRSRSRSEDSWTAFLLSVVLPGTGQLWKGHASAPWWLLGGALLIALGKLLAENVPSLPQWFEYLVYIVYCLACGVHAARTEQKLR